MPTNDRYAYLDTSAFVKLCWPELESQALRDYLRDWPLLVSATLLLTEALRAAHRQPAGRIREVEDQLQLMALLEVDRALFRQAGRLGSSNVRSSDAIHVAAALSLGADLGTIVTYDDRMIAAATVVGLPVACPS